MPDFDGLNPRQVREVKQIVRRMLDENEAQERAVVRAREEQEAEREAQLAYEFDTIQQEAQMFGSDMW